MGGFKSGAADDDWGDSEYDTDADEVDQSEDNSDDRQADETIETGVESPEQSVETSGTSAQRSTDLPWVLTRNSITDGRDKTVQLHLQQSTIDVQRDARRSVEDRLGETVKKADLREAALLVGLSHPEELESMLREWGYDIES
ncbi:hypothetical protein [Halorubrum tebenquichense]|uniref:Uncharacterized protein n=1 Tax=Halorubrum tebenquichense DSM 14210 TaxID=1227485 RepID=M0DCN8_9EURY|nr:hypothetical protein [Halorubrum tebenquichense]ELZ33251.1 hypothetical protein C472_15122 [Halorubrum tebenquichense DSM 14210]